MPAPLAVIAAAGIMFTFIWAVCKVFNINPSAKGNYPYGFDENWYDFGADDDSITK